MATQKNISELIAETMITDAQLADMLMVTTQCVNKWRNCHGLPSIDSLVGLSQVLNTTIDELIKLDD